MERAIEYESDTCLGKRIGSEIETENMDIRTFYVECYDLIR